MHSKLCCCAARAYSKTLIVLWRSQVNWQLILAQLSVVVSEARLACVQRGQATCTQSSAVAQLGLIQKHQLCCDDVARPAGNSSSTIVCSSQQSSLGLHVAG